MNEKYFDINPLHARQLLDQAKKTKWSKRGIDRHAYLIGDYAVLSTNRMKLRNVTTRDDNLSYFDEIIETLLNLYHHGVSVVPILGYSYDPNSVDGTGFIIQKRAKGLELFDDAVLAKFESWAQSQSENIYLHSNMSDAEKIQYLLSRTQEISHVPQEHFDKFVNDMICILKHDILIDCGGKSNFFYDTDQGFQFIDLDTHNDYKYGLTDQKPDIEKTVSICGFVPCLYASGTKLFSSIAMDEHAILALTPCQRNKLAESNNVIFQKCIAALRQNGISESILNKSLSMLKFYGVE